MKQIQGTLETLKVGVEVFINPRSKEFYENTHNDDFGEGYGKILDIEPDNDPHIYLVIWKGGSRKMYSVEDLFIGIKEDFITPIIESLTQLENESKSK